MADTVCVPISTDLYAEFILRSGKSVDVASWIENILYNYLDNTELDDIVWSKEYVEKALSKLGQGFEDTFGDPDGFYKWSELLLWNGTRIRMSYKGENYYADVRGEKIVFEERTYSPSQLASKFAAGTSRNAWRDLWIKERDSDRWILAYDLRQQRRSITPAKLEGF